MQENAAEQKSTVKPDAKIIDPASVVILGGGALAFVALVVGSMSSWTAHCPAMTGAPAYTVMFALPLTGISVTGLLTSRFHRSCRSKNHRA